MEILNIVLGQDKSSYNLTLVLIYLLILVVLFAICVIASQKLQIFGCKNVKKENLTDENVRSSIDYEHQKQ